MSNLPYPQFTSSLQEASELAAEAMAEINAGKMVRSETTEDEWDSAEQLASELVDALLELKKASSIEIEPFDPVSERPIMGAWNGRAF